jgi:hypothetical protein
MRVPDAVLDLRLQLSRQVAHWTAAATELEDLTRAAPAAGWAELETYLGSELQRGLRESVDRLRRQGDALQAALRATDTWQEHQRLRREVITFRERYLRVETLVDFYGDAICSRANPQVASYLRACDLLATRAMAELLVPLGHRPPPLLTYLDKGLGASILKAGLRLWDGWSESRVATIKIARHNRCHPTALLHEAGHQAAHMLGWTEELAVLLARGLPNGSAHLGQTWAQWASELVADAFAFNHAGYAAVSALHDVLSGPPAWVMHIRDGDPHPVSYLRVLLGCAMCTRFYGAGPWDALASAWRNSFPLEDAGGAPRDFFEASQDALPRVVELLLLAPCRAFGGRSLAACLDPTRVSPAALAELERRAGPALFSSSWWVERECLRLLALSGLRAATLPEQAEAILRQQEAWMAQLGGTPAARA